MPKGLSPADFEALEKARQQAELEKQRLQTILESMIGKTPFDVMPPEQKQRGAQLFAEFARSPRPFSRLEPDADLTCAMGIGRCEDLR